MEVDGEARLSFRRALIATGARPAAPPIPGLAEVGFRTNETIFDLQEPGLCSYLRHRASRVGHR